MARSDIYINALKQAGRRITEQRRVICDYLARTDTHPTPYQIYDEISLDHPEISRATVYNTLNVLQELGAIVEIGFGAAHTHYDTNPAPHVNLLCLRCHKIVDYHGRLPLDSTRDFLGEDSGFQPVAIKLEVLGFCETCRERKKAEIREQWLQRKNEFVHDEAAQESEENS